MQHNLKLFLLLAGKLLSNKWINLRDAWTRSNRNEKNTKSGAGTKYRKPYIYKEQMKFLKTIANPKPTHESVSKRSSTTDSDYRPNSRMDVEGISQESAQRSQNMPSSSKKYKKMNVKEKMCRFLDSRLAVKEEDPMLSFFKGVLPAIRPFDDDEILEFQSGILSLIQKIKKKHRDNLSTNYAWNTQSRNNMYRSGYLTQNQTVDQPPESQYQIIYQPAAPPAGV